HRRTYIGAMPGRILQAIRRAESHDPVFMLDEVDKIGADWRGDPSSALLEVLDPEQNKDFRDNYLDVPFDLSKVMFITTANSLDTIPPALRDRMEVLHLSGYTEHEKVQIATRFLIPKQVLAHGLHEGEVTVSEDALRLIIREYTREAGVRNLEREIASLIRRDVADIASGKRLKRLDDIKKVRAALGKRRFFDDVAERIDRPGVATGLVWTPTGGEIIFRGRGLPIGGIKEKVLGAHRAGLRRVLLPAHNEADLDDIPADLRKQMQFVMLESIDQVLREALAPKAAVGLNGGNGLRT